MKLQKLTLVKAFYNFDFLTHKRNELIEAYHLKAEIYFLAHLDVFLLEIFKFCPLRYVLTFLNLLYVNKCLENLWKSTLEAANLEHFFFLSFL